MIKILALVLIALMGQVCFAEVKDIHVIFLSRPGVSIIPFIQPYHSLGIVATNSKEFKEKCVEMGDGCFHPQHGLVVDPEKLEKLGIQKNVEVKTISAQEVDLVDCKKGYYFDMYCGKAKKAAKPASFELWIDTSSSMRQVDFSLDQAFCERRRLVSKLKDSCKADVDVFIFDTAKKLSGELSSSCLNVGTNNSERLVEWLRASDADHVVIVTDVDEYKAQFREYLDLKGATVEGIGTSPIYASTLFDYHKGLTKLCQ